MDEANTSIQSSISFVIAMEKGYVEVNYVKTESQLADSFTKPLGHIKFEEFREKLGVATMNEARIKEEFVSG